MKFKANQIMRYLFIVIIIAFSISKSFSQDRLPVGTHPQAIEFDHFPSRLHAFVWRNWNLVDVGRMAEVLNCSDREVESIASSMGLDERREVPASYKKLMYITIIRRNWHLLPYEQLLVLLDMEEEELEIALKEDDFLFHKLGRLKPDCDLLNYEKPGASQRKEAANIRKIVKSHFGEAMKKEPEPRFSFIEDLMKPGDRSYKPSDNREGLKYIYSYFGLFGDPLLNPELDPYPDGLLEKLAIQGVNGIWLHVVLNQLYPADAQFPEFGDGSDIRLMNLQKIVDRAENYGIKLYLYINEPRAMPHSFFATRPEIAGATQGDYTTMCTSTELVSNWITDGMAHVFKEVKGLGGVFTITASENLTNCASHNLQGQCTRCSKRPYADIIAGVNRSIAEGVHRSAPDAKVIVWDWGWNGHGDATEVIQKLPDDVWFQSVSEWDAPLSRGGVETKVGEYSISVMGPGPRALSHWKTAQEKGLKTVAKVQFNNTWELSAVPWLPVMDLIAGHAHGLSQAGLDGYMLSWSLGGYPSPNLEIANRFSRNPEASIDEVLNALSRERYGEAGTEWARKAWTAFSTAFQHFPYGAGVVYNAPQQYGPSNLLFGKPTGYASTMVGFPYDDLDGWRGPYSRLQFARQFEKIAEGWKEGLNHFEKLLQNVSEEYKATAQSDYGVAKAAYLHFYSVANQCNFVIARDNYLAEKGKPSVEDIQRILDREIQAAVQLFELVQKDSRIGFEASNQYYYVPQDLMEKVINAEYLKNLLR